MHPGCFNLQRPSFQQRHLAFRELHLKLKVFENDPYEKRAFLYLDILSWLESANNLTWIFHIR